MLLLLVVDDDAVDREKVRRSLALLQADIHEADTCESCLKKVSEYHFDLILMDYRLPDGNGIDLTRQIRESGVSTPVVLVTDFGEEDLVINTVEAGLMDYVPKNKLTPEFLARTVINALLIYKTHATSHEVEEENMKKAAKNLAAIIAAAKNRIEAHKDQ